MDAYLWLAPCLILLILFVLMPVLEVFRMAFSKISPANLLKEFGTLENFQYLFRQKVFGPGLLGGTLAAFAGGREKPSSLLPMPVKRLRRSRLRSAAASGRRPCARGLFPHAPILSPARFFR